MSETKTKTRDEVRTKEPPLYKTICINDDFTTMDFVVDVLMEIFGKEDTEAIEITMDVHRRGKGVAGVYVYEIAEAKVEQAHSRAREQGFPFRMTIEPEK